MMRSIPLRLAALLLPLFLVACGDLPTNSPAPEVTVAGRLLDCYRIDPETVRCSDEGPVWDDECDPYHYDCGADDCIESTGGGDVESTSMQACPPPAGGGSTGGPGPGPGGGGGSGSGSTNPGNPTLAEKDGSGACPGCGERQPQPDEKQVMVDLLATILCQDGRQTLESMFAAGTILVYTQDDTRWGSYDSSSGLIYVSRSRHWLTGGVDTAELADTMVHEALHKLLGHVNGQPHSETHGQQFKDKMASCGFPQT